MKVPGYAMLALLMVTSAGQADPAADFAGDDQAYSGDVRGLLQDTRLDGCVQLLERAFYLADPASFDRALDARQEMELARDAFHAGDAFACKRHAMHALEDRS